MVLITDKFSRASAGAGESPNPATTEAVKAEAATSLTVDSTVGWSTTTPVHFIMYDIDSSKKEVLGSRTHWKGLVSSSTTINNLTLTAGTDKEYSSGAKVVSTPTPAWADALVEGVRSTLQDDGKLKDSAVTTPKIQDKAVTDGKRLLGTGFRAGLSAIQSIPSTTVTVIDFSSLTDYERFDLGGHYDTTLKRFVATQKVSMTFDALARINNLDENKIVYIYLRKNGSSFQRGYNLSPAANAEVQVKVEAPVILDIGDYLDVAIYHNNGTTLDLQATDYSNFSGTLNGVVS